MRVALYARVSTDEQTPDSQLCDLRKWCTERNWQISHEYIDSMSGAKDSRPALNTLMADAARGRFKAVAVWRFDRFARSTIHLCTALETFHQLGVDFLSYSEAVDTTTPMGKCLFQILAAVAELERSIIRERVKAGLRAARDKGRTLGRPLMELPQREIVLDMRYRGMPWRAIGQKLNISDRTLRRFFNHEAKTLPERTAKISQTETF